MHFALISHKWASEQKSEVAVKAEYKKEEMEPGVNAGSEGSQLTREASHVSWPGFSAQGTYSGPSQARGTST